MDALDETDAGSRPVKVRGRLPSKINWTWLAAEYLNFDDRWMALTVWRKMEDKMPSDKSIRPKWVQYTLVEMAAGLISIEAGEE